MHTYKVTTTKAIVKEMARYEEAEYEQGKFVRLGRINPITDETEAKAKCLDLWDEASLESMLEYQWTITSERPPSRRWASFGVAIQ